MSVCLSDTSRCCIETTGRIELVLARRLPSTYHTLCYKKIWVSPKTGVLPSGTLSKTPDLENFATASRSRCQQNSSSSSSTVEFVDDIYTTDDESWLFTTSRSTVTPLTALLRFVVDLSYNSFLRLTRFWPSWRVARSVCGSRASCRLLVIASAAGFQKLFPLCDRRRCRRKAKRLWKDWFRSFPENSTLCRNWDVLDLEQVGALYIQSQWSLEIWVSRYRRRFDAVRHKT